MKEIIKLINIASSQIFGTLLGFQATLIFIDIMEVRESKLRPWLGYEWIKEHKSDIKKRLLKIIIIIITMIVYVIIANLIYKNY